MTIRITINGVAGRMGRMLTQACASHPDLQLSAGIEHSDSPFLGQDAGLVAGIDAQQVKIQSSLEDALQQTDVVIDFTRPKPTLAALKLCQQADVRMVIGTTGFTDTEQLQITDSARQVPLVMAPNFSVGVTVCLQLLQQAAKALSGYDVEVIEAHHRYKVDAPSGTALKMGEVVAAATGRDLADCAVYGREGHTGERQSDTIGFETIRAGDIIGDHTVLFADTGERVEITHRATNRLNFANGAMRAAAWLMHQKPGEYNMFDVLNLKESL